MRGLTDSASAQFDSATETWAVTGPDGRTATAAIVVDARPSASPVIARHGVPNYFRIPGRNVRREARYVSRCLRLVERSGAARIEAKPPSSCTAGFPLRSNPASTSPARSPADDLYDGPAMVTVGERSFPSRVRLTGHLDAIDGRYHWQGHGVRSAARRAPPGCH